MSTEWYYAKDNQQLGPVPANQLKILASTGQLSPEDLVWKEGMPEWQPAGKIKGLFGPGHIPAAAAIVNAPAAQAQAQPVQEQEHAPAQQPSPGPAQPNQISYYNPNSTSVILKGFPRPTGPAIEWPLDRNHLEQLKTTESYRKPIRTCAGLLNILGILYAIVSVFIILGGSFGFMFAPRGGAAGGVMSYVAGMFAAVAAIAVGITVLAFLGSRATTKCRMWGAIVFLVLFSLVILLQLFSIVMAMGSSSADAGAALAGGVIGMILPVVFAIVCLRAVTNIPKFLASPVWCQEALVNAKL